MEKKALLIIDIQKDFTSDNARMPVDKEQADLMITNLNKLTDRIDPADTEIIYIGNEYKKWDLLNVFRNFASIEGSEGAQLDERLHKVSSTYFSKTQGNALSNPKLVDYLRTQGISGLLISGLKTEFCVYATVKAALKKHFKTTVLTDCIATTSEKKRQAMIATFKRIGANTLESSQICISSEKE